MKAFDFKTIKEIYDKANKNFNPKAHKLDAKDPNPQFFTSKLYFKFLSMNNKMISRALKKGNPEYYNLLNETNGDYSRRKGGHVTEELQEHVSWCKGQIRVNPTLKYSIVGVFCDVYELLKDLRWRAAFKLSFDYCRKHGDNKTIAAAIKSLYFAMAISCETMFLKIIELEYSISVGETIEQAALSLQNRYAVFMKKSVIPSINLYVLMSNIQDPLSYVKSVITGEDKAKRATENFTIPMYKEEGVKSVEGALFDTMKSAGGAIANIAASGIAAIAGFASAGATHTSIGTVTGLVTGGSALTGGALGFIIGVIGALWFIFTIIPSIRIIIYYAAISKINVQKELALHEEMLANNIAVLKARYDGMKDGEAKQKLGETIKKQQKMYEDLLAKINNMASDNYSDDTATDNALSTDESEADKEAETLGTDTNTDGDSSDGDSFDVLI